MSRKSTPSKSETHHSETPSQKRARNSADGGMFTKGPVPAEEVTVSAVGEAAAEAASAKTAANEAIANAKRLEKIAKDMQKKTPLTVQPKSSTPQVTKPTPPGSRRAPVDTPVTSHKRKSSVPAKPVRSPRRDSGPLFDASLADVRPPKAVVVDASLNTGYARCVITLLFPNYSNTGM